MHWKAPDWCRETVDAVLMSRDVELCVTVVNNSPDVPLDLPAEVRVLVPGGNLGFAGGANYGLDRMMPGPVFVGCHDVTVAPNALAEMLRMLHANPDLGIVGPVLNDEGCQEVDLEWVSGTLMLLRPELASSLRFDTRFGSYVEDVDLCIRARIGQPPWRVGRCGTAFATSRGSVDPALAARLTDGNMLALCVQHRLWRQLAGRGARLAWQRRWSTLAFGARQGVRLRRRLPTDVTERRPSVPRRC